MSRHPDDDLYGDNAGHQPFWAHAQIDGTALDVVTTLVHALATRWVAEDLADRFGYSVAIAAATVVMGGDGTFDLWEEPGRLVCHLARSGAPDATAPQRTRGGCGWSPGPRGRAGTSPGPASWSSAALAGSRCSWPCRSSDPGLGRAGL